jgi:hypothetical protein
MIVIIYMRGYMYIHIYVFTCVCTYTELTLHWVFDNNVYINMYDILYDSAMLFSK